MWERLIPADPGLFFSKGDPHDPRLGEVVRRLGGPQDAPLLEGADAALLGVPEDRGILANKGREGARLGPRAIRKAFYRLTPGFNPFLSDLKLVDLGDIRTQGRTLEEVHEDLASVVGEVAALGVVPLVLGGGHDLAYPDLLGLCTGLKLGEGQLGVINVDQHLDVRDLSFGGITSGTPFYRALEELPGRPLRGENFVEYGVQESHNSPYYYNWLMERRATILTLGEVQGRPIETFLKSLQLAGRGPRVLTVSVDIDAVRSTDAPGASAGSPNGLSAQDVAKIAHLAGRTERVRLLDILETCPPLDQDGRTASLAADILFWFLKGMCERR